MRYIGHQTVDLLKYRRLRSNLKEKVILGVSKKVFRYQFQRSLKPLFRSVIFDRSAVILKSMLGEKVSVYSGDRFSNFYITRQMVGFKFGEFSFTKQSLENIHKKTFKKEMKYWSKLAMSAIWRKHKSEERKARRRSLDYLTKEVRKVVTKQWVI